MQRLPVPIIAGDLTPQVGVDIPFGVPSGATLTAVFLSLEGPPAGGTCVVHIRDAAGGGGNGLVATFAAGARFATAVGSIALGVATTLYLRVVSVSGAPSGLSGTVELDGGEYLTTLVAVRERLGRTAGTPTSLSASELDALIHSLNAAASARIKAFCRRLLTKKTLTERYDAPGDRDVLQLRQFPIVSVTEVRVDAAVVAASAYAPSSVNADAVFAARGQLVRMDGGDWPESRRGIEVTYVAGYDPVPADLADAATIQVLWDLKRTEAGGGRIGLRATVIGDDTATFMVDEWAPDALSRLRAYRAAA